MKAEQRAQGTLQWEAGRVNEFTSPIVRIATNNVR